MDPAETLKGLNIGFTKGQRGYRADLPTLVMVHGAGGSSRFWNGQVHPLAKEVNSFALDLPGHGNSPGPGRDSIASYAEWLRDVLGRLPGDRLFLMGHSMGGAIVQEAALRFPDMFSGIILAATGPRLTVAPQFLEGLTNRFDETVETIIKYAYAADADPALIRQGAQLMKEPGAIVVHDDFLACDRFDRRNDLSHLRVPCLIICGEEDKLSPPVLSQRLRDALPDATLVMVPSAGHMVMIENLKIFNQAVLDFIVSSGDSSRSLKKE